MNEHNGIAQSAPRTISGVGLGLRPPHYAFILENFPDIPWFEAISENYIGLTNKGLFGRPLDYLQKIREHYPIVLHGVSLSIASTDPFGVEYLSKLKELCKRIEPTLISDHFCWTGVDGINLHDLMPIPYTQKNIYHLVERIDYVQNFLGREILLENVSSYISFTYSEMPEWEFIREVANSSGCKILLDINNIYVSSVNHKFDPLEFILGVPKKLVKQFHLAGHTDRGAYLIDTHDHPVPDPVWDLYKIALQRLGDIPSLIERDDNIPDFPMLYAEAKFAEEIRAQYKLRSSSSEVSHAP